jgi:hypothetical protein
MGAATGSSTWPARPTHPAVEGRVVSRRRTCDSAARSRSPPSAVAGFSRRGSTSLRPVIYGDVVSDSVRVTAVFGRKFTLNYG